MNCEAVIGTALRDDGTTSLPTLGCSPPLRLMPTPEGVHIVGAAAAPLNGDRVSLEIFVAPGTQLTVRTVAASIAWPGTSPVPSQFTIRAHVGRGAKLEWLPEPLVPVDGCVHRINAQIDIDDDATLVWREELVLGRHNEPPGELSSELRIDGPGRSLLRQELTIGGRAHTSPAVLAGHRASGSLTFIGGGTAALTCEAIADESGESALLDLEGARQFVAVASSAVELRRRLDGALTDFNQAPQSITSETRTSYAPLS
jgi:urease accessory protein